LDETARVARRSDLASIMRGTALTAAHLEMADAKVLRELIDIVVLRFRRSHVRAQAHYAVLHAMARRLKAAVENAGVLREGSRRGRRDQQRSAAA
jgi:hypothetical protein